MFRIANTRRNKLIECEASVMFSFMEKETNIRRFLNLDLELKKITGLSLSWTIVHPITEDSPINEITAEEFKQINAEFIFMFKAFDDTYSQQVYTRHSYTAEELVWNAKFKPMFHRSEDGYKTVLEMHKIGEHEILN